MVPLCIEDLDFVANFTDGHWTVSWKWTEESPKKMQTESAANIVAQLEASLLSEGRMRSY